MYAVLSTLLLRDAESILAVGNDEAASMAL